MGFWSKLAKGLAIAGGVAATVGTAGAASPALAAALGMTGAGAAGLGAAGAGVGALSKLGKGAKTVSDLSKIAGPIASGIATGQQKGREATNTNASNTADFKLRESNLNEDNQISRANLDLQRRQDSRAGQSDSYKKALQSALTMNTKDFEIDPASLPAGVHLIKSTGGLKPSAIGPEGMAAAKELNRQAMEKLMSGEKFDDLPALERTQPGEFKQPGALENIAGGIGLGASAINSYNAGQQQDSMQAKIQAAIEALNPNKAGTQAGPANVTLQKPTLAGVQPFFKPPTGVLQDPYGNVDESNR